MTTVAATWVQRTGASQGVFHVKGTRGPIGVGIEHRILDAREPGDNLLNVGSSHNFTVGDSVWVTSRPTERWTDLLEVTEIWGGSELPEMSADIREPLSLLMVQPSKLISPLLDSIDNVLVPGSVQEYTWRGAGEHVGIKNLIPWCCINSAIFNRRSVGYEGR